MAGKKKLKQKLADQTRIADDLFTQLNARSAELNAVDEFIRNGVLPGPSLGEWAGQTAMFLQELVKLRGIVSSGLLTGRAEPVEVSPARSCGKSPMGGTAVVEALLRQDTEESTHSLLTPEEAEARDQFKASVSVPAGEGRFA